MAQLAKDVWCLDELKFNSDSLDQVIDWWIKKNDQATPEEKASIHYRYYIDINYYLHEKAEEQVKNDH